MTISRSDLERRFRNKDDEDLLDQCCSGDLTDFALEIAGGELSRRGLSLPAPDVAEQEELAAGSGPLVRIATHLNYPEAQVLQSFLQFEGIPAILSDAYMATANMFLSAATGGIRLMVHQSNLAKAEEIAAAFRCGECQIDDDYDVGTS